MGTQNKKENRITPEEVGLNISEKWRKQQQTMLEGYFNRKSQVFRNLANTTEDADKANYYKAICYSYLIVSHNLSNLYNELFKIRELMSKGNIDFELEDIIIRLPEEDMKTPRR